MAFVHKRINQMFPEVSDACWKCNTASTDFFPLLMVLATSKTILEGD